MSGPERLGEVVVCMHDEATLDLLYERLAEDRFEPLPAVTTEEALRLCRHHLPDLLIVGLDLPDEGRPELPRRIREAHWLTTQIDPYLPVLALRPRGGDPDGRGPELIADELLHKLFTYDDLRTTAKAILRRRHGRLDRPVRVGDVHREVRPAKKYFTLLRVLAGDPTRGFANEELIRDVWGLRGPAAEAHTLDSHASGLRRKLDPEDRRFVRNCWGVGCWLVETAGPVRSDVEEEPR